jgi:nitrate reductase gamma subunit
MNAFYSLVAVVALVLVAILGTGAGLHDFFGVVVPYAAIVVFLVGFILKVVSWARSPVPFRIPTTCGQQESLPWIPQAKLDNPSTGGGVLGRMLLEILFFRSLFRNTEAEVRPGPKLVYGSSKWLWLGALLFHWAFLIILLRHLRFFTEPVPGFVSILGQADGFFQITLPALYVSTILFTAALLFLFVRRLASPQVRYISLIGDYFPLLLLLGIAVSGIWMRHLGKVDIAGIKELGVGLLSFSPTVPTAVGAAFWVHLFLVCVLFAYFPFSKLMHLGGVFLSPTRNLANNNRMVRHVNPWNPDVKVHTYEEWQEEFKEEVEIAGYEWEGGKKDVG